MLCEVRVSYLTFMRILRLSTFLVLSLLMDVQGSTQAQAPPSSQSQATAAHPDTKRAQKAAERGDKAAAAGRFEEALTAYEEAAHCAPQDAAIVERSEEHTSELQSHSDLVCRLLLEKKKKKKKKRGTQRKNRSRHPRY